MLKINFKNYEKINLHHLWTCQAVQQMSRQISFPKRMNRNKEELPDR